ncbi:M23 family metallopeptidase [Paracoccus aerodenitrificans]|uniref:M23 family metallopeptidase n=1 Tax=Paracoccus aerodenitrificans TaxID=3017781 RepID=UPI0022F144EE|nr:M23 family metallopeptidase [Paracoccus aerodenitrificans]WBU65088.1 M23 family metallopeptidase [Paracoccus aerodenitrificans]
MSSRTIFKSMAAMSLTVGLAGCSAFPAVQQDIQRIGGGGSTATSFPSMGRAADAGNTAGASPVVRDPFAGQGVAQPDIPGGGATSASNTASATTTMREATTHRVVAGETGWSIARRYGISVQQLAEANSLDAAMTLRVGQSLNIPAHAVRTANTVTAPGTGSPTPTPPSASQPLPDEETAPSSAPSPKPATPDLGATRTAASGSGRFRMPVAGAIVRTYSKGSNEGIDIAAAPGTAVEAAGNGSIAAITRDTDGVPIVVIRHEGELLTVYAGLSQLSVQKGDQVSAGQKVGTAGNSGSIHFEVRQGFESADPEDYL